VKEKRRRIWIDRFQTYLSLRIAVYFVFYQVAIWCLVAVELRVNSLDAAQAGPASRFGSMATRIAIVTLGVLFICDALRLAHRVVGPIFRFRQAIQAVTAGGEVELVGLRQDDFLQDLKTEINDMLRALEQRGAITLKKAGAPPEQEQEPKQEQKQPVSA
jgi:nitrogen fixation/metabolism regulation signal transduction histidine kinase